MSKYTVTDDGIAALNQLNISIYAALQQIKGDCSTMFQITEENLEGLGPHAKSILQIIKSVAEHAKRAENPVIDLCEALQDLMKDYQNMIEYDRYSGTSSNH